MAVRLQKVVESDWVCLDNRVGDRKLGMGVHACVGDECFSRGWIGGG